MNSTFGRLGAAATRPAPAIAVVATALPMNSRRVTLRGMPEMLHVLPEVEAAASGGFHRSPIFATRAGTLAIVKSSMRSPFSISFHVTGVDTVASGRGRGE